MYLYATPSQLLVNTEYFIIKQFSFTAIKKYIFINYYPHSKYNDEVLYDDKYRYSVV